ncbi:MAG: nuclear transport factor 2 family protein [Acidobacteriota bacterium]|nr:nuclear transport factor 2 family protein [Acidobacteriota bacterium]
MKAKSLLFIAIVLFLTAAAGSSAAQTNSSVWTVDFVKTKDGQQTNYLKFIEQNWARARSFMKQKGIANSYQVLSLPASDKAEWDVLLMTEYANQAGYEQREAVFQEYRKTAQTVGNDAANKINPREISEIKFSRVFYQPISSETAKIMLAAQTTDAEKAAARIPLENYLQGHATGNPEFMRKAFHTEGSMIFIRDGKYSTRTFAEYIAGMSGKPAADEANRRRWIESVDVSGNAATGKIILDYPSGKFVDYMTLLKINGEWKIINKSFYFEAKTTGGK